VVTRNVAGFLEARGREERPLFLYVNFQDCHFPYHHTRLEPRLLPDPVSRDEIVPGNAARVYRTYLNAAAHVDAAVGTVLAAFEKARGRPAAFVLVGDHGEAFFGQGMLGHGLDLVGEQMQVPFLARGLPVDCTFPLGLADVRGVLRRALVRPEETPRTAADPAKWIFKYTGSIDAPWRVGAAGLAGGVIFDVQPRAYRTWGDPPPALAPPFPAVVTRWEQIVLRRRAR
jgi:hypothetical protein